MTTLNRTTLSVATAAFLLLGGWSSAALATAAHNINLGSTSGTIDESLSTTVNIYSNHSLNHMQLSTVSASQPIDADTEYSNAYAASATWKMNNNQTYNVHISQESAIPQIMEYAALGSSKPSPELGVYSIQPNLAIAGNGDVSFTAIDDKATGSTEWGQIDFVLNGKIPAGNHEYTVTVTSLTA